MKSKRNRTIGMGILCALLGIFLREYLLYRYDHDELLDEGEE